MASLFNNALANDSIDEIYSKDKDQLLLYKLRLKNSYALWRASLYSSFSFLEADLNGIAADTLLSRGQSLSQSECDLLREWDSSRARLRFVSLRDKILHYPRIALGEKHPPFQENNTAGIAFILGTAKGMRDAITHAGVLDQTRTGVGLVKEELVYEISREDVEPVIDAVTALVSKIHNRIYGNNPAWIRMRGEDMTFPAETFT